jgi:hypothetical protein
MQIQEQNHAPLTTDDLQSFQSEVRLTLERKLASLVEQASILRRTIGANRKEIELEAVQRTIDAIRLALNFKNPEGVPVA